jgi:hypothetical protein
MIRIRNKTTGAITSIPEGALPMFTDWEPADGPPPDKAKPKKNLTSQTDAVSTASNEKE